MFFDSVSSLKQRSQHLVRCLLTMSMILYTVFLLHTLATPYHFSDQSTSSLTKLLMSLLSSKYI